MTLLAIIVQVQNMLTTPQAAKYELEAKSLSFLFRTPAAALVKAKAKRSNGEAGGLQGNRALNLLLT